MEMHLFPYAGKENMKKVKVTEMKWAQDKLCIRSNKILGFFRLSCKHDNTAASRGTMSSVNEHTSTNDIKMSPRFRFDLYITLVFISLVTALWVCALTSLVFLLIAIKNHTRLVEIEAKNIHIPSLHILWSILPGLRGCVLPWVTVDGDGCQLCDLSLHGIKDGTAQ